MRALIVMVLVMSARVASAHDICVVSDPARDRLTQDEQASAHDVFTATLLASDQQSSTACTETWTLVHVRLGTSIHVLVETPHGAVTATAPSFDALGITYEGLVWRALSIGGVRAAAVPAPLAAAMPGATATVAPSPAMKSAVYVRIGYAVQPALTSEIQSRFGPTIGIGYRRAVEGWLLDASIMNTHTWQNNVDTAVNVLSFGRLVASRLLTPGRDTTCYGGGGFSIGQATVLSSDEYPTATREYAVQADAVFGYEMLRDKAAHLFFEAWLVAPLSAVTITTYDAYGPVHQKVLGADDRLFVRPWLLIGDAR